MRRLSLALAAVFALAGASAHAQNMSVGPGQATNISLGAPVRDIVVADPLVADVSLVNERTLVVMGKHPGVTAIMAFDAAGRTLTNRLVVVSDNASSLTVYRGAAATNYVCDEQCSRIAPR
jgi:Flp pilus assembly secretin CpaC